MRSGSIISSMYHRRLVLLFLCMVAAASVLAAQMARLTIVQGAEYRDEAESRLVNERWTPTHRGRIVDRKGRILALDRPSFDVAVDYRVITGYHWAFEQAAREARRAIPGEWPKLSRAERAAIIERDYLPAKRQLLEDLWDAVARFGNVDREEIERRKQQIIREVQSMAEDIWARRLERERRMTTQRETAKEYADVARPIREQRTPHVILHSIDDSQAFKFNELAEQLPGVSVIDATARDYPLETMRVVVDRASFPGPLKSEDPVEITVEGVATHVLGWMRNRIYKEDHDRRRAWRASVEGPHAIDRGHYQPGDSAGAAGLEESLEPRLRGLRGRITTQLDTGEREEIAANPGHDVALTIDISLQARIQALMDPSLGLTTVQPYHNNTELPEGTELNAAAVVIDVESGDILSMVSHPSFTRAQMRDDPDSVFRDILRQPWINRPIATPYQPGSPVKPLVLAEAVSRGVHTLSNRIECHGHFLPNRPDLLRCWIFRPQFGMANHSMTFGALNGSDAICVSCNIYFYHLGRELGPKRLTALYQRYGVNTPYDLGLPGASGGAIGHSDGSDLIPFDTMIMGIGQGPVAWTPLHAADAYATLARKGVRLKPRLLTDAPAERRSLDLNAEALNTALDGLKRVVNDQNGTAHHLTIDGRREPLFNAPGVTVLAKT
ncbi:MAG: penicillin-binding transpeptidase domain-containing protein, partial [Planctomycetota bacterium]|nr:penicillin-binding transpeptidase domain-containing protein [Planctomycetota bacterium]